MCRVPLPQGTGIGSRALSKGSPLVPHRGHRSDHRNSGGPTAGRVLGYQLPESEWQYQYALNFPYCIYCEFTSFAFSGSVIVRNHTSDSVKKKKSAKNEAKNDLYISLIL